MANTIKPYVGLRITDPFHGPLTIIAMPDRCHLCIARNYTHKVCVTVQYANGMIGDDWHIFTQPDYKLWGYISKKDLETTDRR